MSAGETLSNNWAILLRAEAICCLSHGILSPAFLLGYRLALRCWGQRPAGATEPSGSPTTGGTYSPSGDIPAGLESLGFPNPESPCPSPARPVCPVPHLGCGRPAPKAHPSTRYLGALRPSGHPLATAGRNWWASIGPASWYFWRPELHLSISVVSSCFSWAAPTPWGNAVLVEKVPHAWAFVHHAGGTHRPAAAPTYPGNPLQYYCLEKSTVRGAWWVIVHGVAKSWT